MKRFGLHPQRETSLKMESKRLDTMRDHSKVFTYLGFLHLIVIYFLAADPPAPDDGIAMKLFRPAMDALFTILPIALVCGLCHTIMLRIKISNESKRIIRLTSTLSNSEESNPLNACELRAIFVCSAIYGIVHFVSVAVVIFYSEVLRDEPYYSSVYWTALVGMTVFGILLYLWTYWREAS